jgi:hypothetical protein
MAGRVDDAHVAPELAAPEAGAERLGPAWAPKACAKQRDGRTLAAKEK